MRELTHDVRVKYRHGATSRVDVHEVVIETSQDIHLAHI
jgi:hypothetical protein